MKKYKVTFCSLLALLSSSAFAATVNINAVTVEISGTKIWLPSDIIAHKGDTVVIHLQTKIPAPGNVHGYSIEGYNVAEVVDEKGKTITVKADKEGIFPIRCQLHPSHIGGQFVVLK